MNLLSPKSAPVSSSTSARVVPRGVAFWLVAATAAMVPAASSVPSPLYAVYQAEFKFSALTLTLIFAVYVFALMASLLTVGRLSDFVGRRVVLAVALVLDAGAMALFLGANGVGGLLLARNVQGFATGAAIGVLGAYAVQPTRLIFAILTVLLHQKSCGRRADSQTECRRDAALRSVSQSAEPHERAALLSAVYVVSYLAFSLPALVVGVLTTHIGLLDTSFGYGGFVALFAVGALALERGNGRARPGAT